MSSQNIGVFQSRPEKASQRGFCVVIVVVLSVVVVVVLCVEEGCELHMEGARVKRPCRARMVSSREKIWPVPNLKHFGEVAREVEVKDPRAGSIVAQGVSWVKTWTPDCDGIASIECLEGGET